MIEIKQTVNYLEIVGGTKLELIKDELQILEVGIQGPRGASSAAIYSATPPPIGSGLWVNTSDNQLYTESGTKWQGPKDESIFSREQASNSFLISGNRSVILINERIKNLHIVSNGGSSSIELYVDSVLQFSGNLTLGKLDQQLDLAGGSIRILCKSLTHHISAKITHRKEF